MSRVLLVVICLAAGSVSLRADDAAGKKELAELQGCWRFVSIEVNGETRDPVGEGEPRWVIKGDKVFYGGVEVVQLTADPSTTPRILDLKFLDPERSYEGIYVIENDTLKICLNGRANAKSRPERFATKDRNEWRLLVFAREKAAPANPTEGLTAYAGVQLRNDADAKAVLVDVPIKGSPAEKAGFRRGDHFQSIAGRRITGGSIEVIEKLEAKDGRKVPVSVERNGAAVDLIVEPRRVSEPVLEIVEAPHSSAAQLRLRQGWLQRKTEPASTPAVSQ